MATVGHLVTMLGVLAFYFMLLESKLERKIQANLATLVPRFNKRALYYIAKLIFFKLTLVAIQHLPTKNSLRVVLQ